MARGKNAAALFEVIHGKDREKSSDSKLSTPKWWFKSKRRDGGLSAMGDSSRAAMPATPRFTEAPVSAAPSPRESEGGSSKLSGMKLVLPSTHTVAFGLMFAAIFGVGFIVGQRFRLEPSPVISEESTADLVAGDARPDVLDIDSVSPLTPAHNQSGEATAAVVSPTVSAAFAAPQVEANASMNSRSPSTSVVTDKARIIGYNYVVIQSYPDAEDAMAAVQKLAEHRIEATVIKGLPNWAGAKTWFSVVGTTGFDRIRNNPQYNQYLASIMVVSDKFAGKSKFRKFEPSAYKWRGAEPANTN